MYDLMVCTVIFIYFPKYLGKSYMVEESWKEISLISGYTFWK